MVKKNQEYIVIAPSFSTIDTDQKLKEAIQIFESKRYKCKYYDGIFVGHKRLGYFAADKEIRLRHLNLVIKDPEVKIIWAFRGGYGATEIVLDLCNINCTKPKILIGFSDITALHFLFNQQYKLQSIHGPVVTSIIDLQSSILDKVFNVLNGDEISINLSPINKRVLENNKIGRKIIGGNLIIICNMIGTKLHPNTNEKILFIEDVNKKGYHVYRYLIHIKNSGLFERIKALIFADFTKSDEFLEPSIKSFCFEHMEDISAFRMSGVGHNNINLPITIGGDAVIKDNELIIQNNFVVIAGIR